jgi:hypothetical protein
VIIFLKLLPKWPRGMWKHHLPSGKCRSEAQWGTSHSCKRDIIRRQKVRSAGEAVRKGSLHTIQGSLHYAAVMGNRVEGPQKTKSAGWHRNPTTEYAPEMKPAWWRDIHTAMFTAALFTAVKHGHHQCPSTGECVKRGWGVPTMECSSDTRKNKACHLQKQG